MTMMPTNVRYNGLLIVDNILRVIAGYTTAAVKTNYAYTLSNNSHVTMTAMTGNRYYIHACYLEDGRIYVPGGYTTTAQKTNYAYIVGSDAWATGAALSAARYGYVAFPYNKNTMYVAGGYNLSNILSYNCTQSAWTTLSTTLPQVVNRGTCSLVGNKAYIIGGMNTTVLRTCYCFDCATNTISTKAKCTAGVRLDAASAYIKGKIYLFGGSSSTTATTGTTTIFIYDPVLNTWSTSSDVLPMAMWGLRAVSYSDDVAIIQYGRYVYCYKPE